jgi:bifunctional enzyme CysN/CysC
MAHQSELIAKDIGAYLESHERKSLLRFITCGSVDDGKSTLIGRLLYESKMVFEDQLSAFERDSKRVGTAARSWTSPCWLTACRRARQGITIDVAHRFSRPSAQIIVADTPATSSTRATW